METWGILFPSVGTNELRKTDFRTRAWKSWGIIQSHIFIFGCTTERLDKPLCNATKAWLTRLANTTPAPLRDHFTPNKSATFCLLLLVKGPFYEKPNRYRVQKYLQRRGNTPVFSILHLFASKRKKNYKKKKESRICLFFDALYVLGCCTRNFRMHP